jgi:hypothetical protein
MANSSNTTTQATSLTADHGTCYMDFVADSDVVETRKPGDHVRSFLELSASE